jgi:hypothetical protein
MPTVTVLDNEFVTLWYHPEKKMVHHKIKKWAYGNDLRNILDKGYESLKVNGGNKWLSDDRLNGALKADDEVWAKTDWFPRVLKVGWKYWAIVLPEKIVGQMNMKRFSEDYQKAGINAMLFSDADLAMKWLESQK